VAKKETFRPALYHIRVTPDSRTFERPERWLQEVELLHLPIHNTKTSNGGINYVMGSHSHLDFQAFLC